jgi:hypothetical protein
MKPTIATCNIFYLKVIIFEELLFKDENIWVWPNQKLLYFGMEVVFKNKDRAFFSLPDG